MPRFQATCVTLAAAMLGASAYGQDWSNPGGNSQRNGFVDVVGPEAPDVLWSGGPPSLAAWAPLTEDGRLFVVRTTADHRDLDPAGSPLYALDLATGEELWVANLPFERAQWHTVLLGVKDGRVFAARSGNGGLSSSKVHAFDAATGDVLWVSTEETVSGPWEGAVFADDGDPILPSEFEIARFDAITGERLWLAFRQCSYGNVCGAAIYGDGVYVVDRVPGGNVLRRFNLETGALEVESDVLPGFLTSTPPMIDRNGRIYVHRAQGVADVDFLYALDDLGDRLSIRWMASTAFASSEFAVGPDGSIYALDANEFVVRLDPDTGTVLDTSRFPISGSLVRMSIDRSGMLYMSTGIMEFCDLIGYEADLTERWRIGVPFGAGGGPALSTDGTLAMAGVGDDLRVFRSFACPIDFDGDGRLSIFDFLAFQSLFDSGDPEADLDGDGRLSLFDFILFQDLFAVGCE